VSAVEKEFQLNSLKLAGKLWGDANGHPVLAIHGWMDNAASFDLLAPLLTDCQVLTIDTAGHGFSDHLPAGSVYNIWSDVADLFSVVDQMGWDTFSIIGHSRGANVGVLMAGSFPDRIKTLTFIDGGSPETVSAKKMPEILAKSVLDKQNPRQPRKFPEREDVIKLRTEGGMLQLTPTQAELLAARGVSQTDGEFYWHADQKLKATSEMRLTPAILQSFYSNISAPVLGVFAEQGLANLFLETPMREEIQHLDWHSLPGTHHFHMDESVEAIASLINNSYNQYLLK